MLELELRSLQRGRWQRRPGQRIVRFERELERVQLGQLELQQLQLGRLVEQRIELEQLQLRSMSGGDTLVVGGQSSLNGLTLIGSTFYWVEAESGIFSVPAAGGSAQSVYANANIDQALGTDGTHLFFTQTSSTGSEIDMVGLDGTGEQALASGAFDLSAVNDSGPRIFVAGGTVYVNGTSNIFTVPLTAGDGGADGGGQGTLITSGAAEVQALFAIDASYIYFSDFTGDLYAGSLTTGAATMILAGSIATGNAPSPEASRRSAGRPTSSRRAARPRRSI